MLATYRVHFAKGQIVHLLHLHLLLRLLRGKRQELEATLAATQQEQVELVVGRAQVAGERARASQQTIVDVQHAVERL